MLSKQIAVAAVIAALQRAAAQDTWTTDQLSGRVNPQLIGDSCHPRATWTLGGSDTIPPCVSEQLVAMSCESMTRALGARENPARMNAYRDCLFGKGSSYEADLFGCLKCKAKHQMHSSAEDAFWKKYLKQEIAHFKGASPLRDSLWDMVVAAVPWHQYPRHDEGQKQAERNFTIQEYYPDAPKSQHVGEFTLEGIAYPKLTRRTLGARNDSALGVRINAVFHLEDGGVVSVWLGKEQPVPVPADLGALFSGLNFTEPTTPVKSGQGQ